MTEVRLSGPSHCKFRPSNCLNQLGFNFAYLCNDYFRSNFPHLRDLGTFFHGQSSYPQHSFHWKFRSRNGLNQLGFNCSVIVFNLLSFNTYLKCYEYRCLILTEKVVMLKSISQYFLALFAVQTISTHFQLIAFALLLSVSIICT